MSSVECAVCTRTVRARISPVGRLICPQGTLQVTTWMIVCSALLGPNNPFGFLKVKRLG